MPGHLDPEAKVLYDEKGLAYLKVQREEKVDFDLNNDGKVDVEDRNVVRKLFRFKKGRKAKKSKK